VKAAQNHRAPEPVGKSSPLKCAKAAGSIQEPSLLFLKQQKKRPPQTGRLFELKVTRLLFIFPIADQLGLILLEILLNRPALFEPYRNALLIEIAQVTIVAERLAQLNNLDMKFTHLP